MSAATMSFPIRLSILGQILAVCLPLLPAGLHAVHAQTTAQAAAELFAIGNSRILWLITGTWDANEQTFVQNLAYRRTGSDRVMVPAGFRLQRGSVERCAVVDDRLHLIYGNGSHHSYTTGDNRRELQLPGRSIPDALAGESDLPRPFLWALVDAATADAVEEDWRQAVARAALRRQLRSSAPSTQTAVITEPAPSIQRRPKGTYHLVKYDGAEWQPGFAAPADCGQRQMTWLCISGGRFHLLWLANQNDNVVHYAWATEGLWTTGPEIRLNRPPQQGLAQVFNGQLIFVAMLPGSGGQGLLECQPWAWWTATGDPGGGRWTAGQPLETVKDETLVLRQDAALGGTGDQLVVYRRTYESMELGFWKPTGGMPSRPFYAVQPDAGPLRESESQKTRELVALVAVGLLFLLVFWRRQESLANPASLPPGFVLARNSKRLLAAVIDMLPASAIVSTIWQQELSQFFEQVKLSMASQEALPLTAEIIWVLFGFRLIYVGYCLAFEMLTFTTPGKRLLGCRVFAETGERPARMQVLIRNLLRLVELEPYLMVWPFLFLVLFTANRQRLGDLLARTVVAEQGEGLRDSQEPQDTA